jgi:O-antigen/teichoic acid export membrane protein
MLPLGLSQITSSILNAVGLEMKSLKNYAISAGLLIISIYFLPAYIGTYSLIVGYLLMSITASILNLRMLSKRNLVSLNFSKTIFSMLAIAMLSTLLTSSVYHLLNNFGLIVSLMLGVLTSLSSTAVLIYVFNIANVKVLIFRNFNR